MKKEKVKFSIQFLVFPLLIPSIYKGTFIKLNKGFFNILVFPRNVECLSKSFVCLNPRETLPSALFFLFYKKHFVNTCFSTFWFIECSKYRWELFRLRDRFICYSSAYFFHLLLLLLCIRMVRSEAHACERACMTIVKSIQPSQFLNDKNKENKYFNAHKM